MMQWLQDIWGKIRSGAGEIPMRIQRGREKMAWVVDPLLFVGFLFFLGLAYDAYSGLETLSEEKAAWTLELMKFYAYVVGGIVLIWQVRISNRRATALEKTAASSEKGNITERFKNAIGHLGGEKDSVKIGGIYTLYHIAREVGEYTDTVYKILHAHAKAIMAQPGYDEYETPSNEIAAILDVFFPTISDDGKQSANVLFKKMDISGWYLRGAEISSRNMTKIVGNSVNLSRAILSQAGLSRARLLGANLSEVRLISANLAEAILSGANLSGARLMEANLSEARLLNANLSRARLSGANLSKARLMNADLTEAWLMAANLSRANLSGANLADANLADANLSGAILLTANLQATAVTVEQLLMAKTLYGANLDAHIREEILQRKPELLDTPATKK